MAEFQQKSFDQLTATELFEIYRIRVAVFVVEQDCAYQEVDDLDSHAQHLFTRDAAGHITAYARLIDEGQQVRIGRVLVAPANRGNGAGRRLVQVALTAAERTYPAAKATVIQAQAYLQDFYASFGFQPTSAIYLDTGIPHLDMVLPRQ